MTSLSSLTQIIPKVKKSFHLTTEHQRVIQWKIIDRMRNRWIIGVKRAVKIRFKEELKGLKSMAEGQVTVDGLTQGINAFINDVQNHDAWVALIRNIFIPVGQDFAERVINDVGKSKALNPKDEFTVDAQILDFLKDTEGFTTDLITEETKKLIGAELAKGVALGEGISLLKKRVESFYLDRIISNRSEVIARTEVIRASNFGSIAGARATGIRELSKVWLATRDLRTRSAHLVEDGMEVPLDSPFILSTGDQLMFPADGSLGASAGQVINCRCTIFFEGE